VPQGSSGDDPDRDVCIKTLQRAATATSDDEPASATEPSSTTPVPSAAVRGATVDVR